MNTNTNTNTEVNEESNSSSNVANDNQQSTASPSSSSPDFRIEIHAFRANDINIPRNLTGTMQQNITSLFNQARNQLGRQADARAWRMNFSNVFQGVRPFVQQAQSINGIRTWRHIALNNGLNNSINGHVNDNNNGNSVTADPNDLGTESTSRQENENRHELNRHSHSLDLENRDINIQRAVATPPARPLLERVAALTRNDPPDLIGGFSVQRNNRNDQNSNNNNEDENAVTEVFETRTAFNTIYRYIPLICILLAKSAYDHLEGLTDFAVLIAVFIHSNYVVKDQITKQTQRKVLILIREFLFILLMVFFKFFATNRLNPFKCLPLFSPITEPPTLSQLLYSVAATDFLLKLITVSIKIFVVIFPPNVIQYKGRGRYFVLIEALSQLYRSLAPIQLWFVFLLYSYSGMEKVLGVIFSAAYMIAKGFDLVDRARLCKKAFIGFFRQVNYGLVPTKDEIEANGGQCPICYDKYDTPVKLECNHIFCELCVGTWFTREQTCPLCRAQVAEDPSWQDGATSQFIQLY